MGMTQQSIRLRQGFGGQVAQPVARAARTQPIIAAPSRAVVSAPTYPHVRCKNRTTRTSFGTREARVLPCFPRAWAWATGGNFV
jgi:hypothetical protein